MSILKINKLALDLVAKDFSFNEQHKVPNNAGPTKTSRALAIIHLAAHDAYAKVTGKFDPQLENLPELPKGIDTDEANATTALLSAGIYAAERLYPDFAQFISLKAAKINIGVDSDALNYGKQVAQAWLDARKNDNSDLPDMDTNYSSAPGRHRPDPLNPKQMALGRTWGLVRPFALKNVIDDAFLSPPPEIDSKEYACDFDEVIECGKSDITQRDDEFRRKAVVGIFWGYDGSNLLGTPPRLYNQVVLEIPEFKSLYHAGQIKILTAINVAMADAGIAAWHWKYAYDVWRPVVGIREAEKGWGASPGKDSGGNALPAPGDGNSFRSRKGDPFWLPLGAPNSNPVKPPASHGMPNSNLANQPPKNGTPNFPAYPSGHATFGSACFEVAAALLDKKPEEITVNFVSDEFNGVTTDNTGATRPRYVEEFTLRKAIAYNNISRIYLGVHWSFDATGGETVGKAVASKVIERFK